MMHEKAKVRMLGKLERCAPEHRDFYLDQYLDCEQRATEWDASEWDLPYAGEAVPGFDREPTAKELQEPSGSDLS